VSTKRIAAREWKRKRKQQQNIFKLSVVGVCILAVLGIGYIAWDLFSRTYVMTFDGQRISTSELRFFTLYAEDPINPRAQALDMLTDFLVIDNKANQHNVVLTAEEMADLNESVADMRPIFEMINIQLGNLSDSRMAAFMGMNLFTERLMDIYTEDLEIDEAVFQEAFMDHMVFHTNEFVEMDFIFHFSENTSESWDAWEELHQAESREEIEAIIMRDLERDMIIIGMEEDGLAELELPGISLAEMRNDPSFNLATLEHLAHMEVGEISEPVLVGESSMLIFIADSLEITPDEVVEERFREQYTMQERIRVFSDMLDEWREEADIRINQRGVNAA